MIHPECGTYGAFERCPDCGLAWCPRCRTWFSARPSGDTGKEAGDAPS